MDIISLLKNALTPQLLSSLSQMMGESEDGVKKGLESIFPTLLLGLMKKVGSGNLGPLTELLDIFKRVPASVTTDDAAPALLDSLTGKGDLASIAGKVLPMLLGDKTQGITSAIASVAGIKDSSVASLLSVAAPMLMGGISKSVGGDLTAGGLSAFLASQKSFIVQAAPAGIGTVMGLGDLSQLGTSLSSFATGAAGSAQSVVKKGSKMLPILVLVVLAALAAFLWKSCSKEDVQSAATTAQSEISKLWGHLGEFSSLKLPNAISLSLPELGVERKLIGFITDPSKEVDTASWFSFDRLAFEKGNATVKDDSNDQLKSIAEILKAYPRVAIKIGGYTDNTGSDETNLNLSQQRAESVRAKLLALGNH